MSNPLSRLINGDIDQGMYFLESNAKRVRNALPPLFDVGARSGELSVSTAEPDTTRPQESGSIPALDRAPAPDDVLIAWLTERLVAAGFLDWFPGYETPEEMAEVIVRGKRP